MSDNNSDYSEYYTVDANENILGSDNSTSNVKSLDGAYENVVKAAQKIDKPIKNLSIIDTINILIQLACCFLILMIIIGFVFNYGINRNSIISMIIITIILILIMVSSDKFKHMLSTRIHNKFLSMVEASSYTYGMLAELKPCMQLVETEKYETDDYYKVFSLIKASDYNTRMPSYIMKYLLATAWKKIRISKLHSELFNDYDDKTLTYNVNKSIDYSGRLISIIYLIREHDKEADFNAIMPETMQLLHDTALRLFAHDYNAIANGPEPFTTAYHDMRAYLPSLPLLHNNIIWQWNNKSYLPYKWDGKVYDDGYNNDNICNSNTSNLLSYYASDEYHHNSHELGLNASSNLLVYYTGDEYNIIDNNHAGIAAYANSSKEFIKYFTMFVDNLQKSPIERMKPKISLPHYNN